MFAYWKFSQYYQKKFLSFPHFQSPNEQMAVTTHDSDTSVMIPKDLFTSHYTSKLDDNVFDVVPHFEPKNVSQKLYKPEDLDVFE